MGTPNDVGSPQRRRHRGLDQSPGHALVRRHAYLTDKPMTDTFGLTALSAVIRRDLRLAMRRKADALTPLFFFAIVVSLFPLGIGPERDTLRQIAPGVLWVAALLASMLSLNRLFEQDYAVGTLEQLVLGEAPLGLLVVGKVIAHWLLSGLTLVLLAPLLALQFDLPFTLLVRWFPVC